MSNPLTAKTNGPSSTFKQGKGNNAVLSGVRPMPQKFGSALGSSMFSRARKVWSNDAGGGQNYNDASSYIALRRNNAIGKSSTNTHYSKDGLINYKSTCNNPQGCLAFKSNQGNRISVKSAVNKVRSGGCVAPAKKGAVANTFKSGGGKCGGC
jgi:hypothetical protein